MKQKLVLVGWNLFMIVLTALITMMFDNYQFRRELAVLCNYERRAVQAEQQLVKALDRIAELEDQLAADPK